MAGNDLDKDRCSTPQPAPQRSDPERLADLKKRVAVYSKDDSAVYLGDGDVAFLLRLLDKAMFDNGRLGEALMNLSGGLAELRGRMWSEIDSAPKDGTPILSWDGDVAVVVVYCRCKREWYLVENSDYRPHPEAPVDWRGITHWMPLPPPPDTAR